VSEPIVRLEGVTKCFGEVQAVAGVDLEIARGELFALLGGSGCGKTTLLRLLRGFETPDTGRVIIDGQDMAGVPPHKRPVNMMFQSYALFPHLDVAGNVGYGLRREGMAKTEIAQRVAEILSLVKLDGLGARRPAQLSGGRSRAPS
jgi:ABC-type Fe3+/spermidine/putrescine transport system ATPase subunit